MAFKTAFPYIHVFCFPQALISQGGKGLPPIRPHNRFRRI